MKNIVCIVQARMSSTRLPNKVLLPLAGKSVLSQVFNQLSFSKLINKVVLATSIDKSDDQLEEWAINNEKDFFRGSLENVLERFICAARKFNADIVIRITADCPLIDPELVDICITEFIQGDYAYFTNTNPPTFPDGLDCEIIKLSALERAYKEAKLKSEIEHVTPYIRNHPEIFKIGNYSSEKNYEFHRWTLDNEEDYEVIKRIYNELYEEGKFIPWRNVIEFLENHPEVAEINSKIKRNEGFAKTLEEDKIIK